MGYTTDFEGAFELDRPLKSEHREYLEKFNETRRMRRDAEQAGELPDPIRIAVGLPVGQEGEFFVGGTGDFGQANDRSVVDHNHPPRTQPGLWCHWGPDRDGKVIAWDGGEKFYDYTKWLQYIIENFIKRWGYVLNGKVEWDGEERSDIGIIEVTNNVILVKHGKISYE